MNDLISKDYLHDKLAACELEFLDAHKYAKAKGVAACMAIVFDTPTIEAEPTYEQVKEYCRKRCLVVVDGALFNEMKSRWSTEPYREFCKWTAEWVLKEDFEESAGAFAELVCRRLAKLGIIHKNGEYWTMDEVEE